MLLTFHDYKCLREFFALARVGISNSSLDSHTCYLSGLLLGIGLVYWVSIPRIKDHTVRIQLLTLIIVASGLARLYGLYATGLPNSSMLWALVMELVVAPALCLWQWRLARAYKANKEQDARVHSAD